MVSAQPVDGPFFGTTVQSDHDLGGFRVLQTVSNRGFLTSTAIPGLGSLGRFEVFGERHPVAGLVC